MTLDSEFVTLYLLDESFTFNVFGKLSLKNIKFTIKPFIVENFY